MLLARRMRRSAGRERVRGGMIGIGKFVGDGLIRKRSRKCAMEERKHWFTFYRSPHAVIGKTSIMTYIYIVTGQGASSIQGYVGL